MVNEWGLPSTNSFHDGIIPQRLSNTSRSTVNRSLHLEHPCGIEFLIDLSDALQILLGIIPDGTKQCLQSYRNNAWGGRLISVAWSCDDVRVKTGPASTITKVRLGADTADQLIGKG